ncbi:hypothetical protein ACHAWO_010222 [Cyclotella atomus]|uniref:Uncharacterized protein n=1 Tax=Cyclotella atomus TaxID=382360 RepID=A0ABD3NS87_9STRA
MHIYTILLLHVCGNNTRDGIECCGKIVNREDGKLRLGRCMLFDLVFSVCCCTDGSVAYGGLS